MFTDGVISDGQNFGVMSVTRRFSKRQYGVSIVMHTVYRARVIA